jgi:hypothetical protein
MAPLMNFPESSARAGGAHTVPMRLIRPIINTSARISVSQDTVRMPTLERRRAFLAVSAA